MYNRLLPEPVESTWKYHNTYVMKYIDIRDAPSYLQEDLNAKLGDRKCSGEAVFKGTQLDRTFRVYIIANKVPIGFFNFWEYLDSPFGYRKGDFLFQRFLVPELRESRYSRLSTADVFHLIMSSEVANHLYTCLQLTKSEGFWEQVDKTNPFVGKLYKTDGPEVQKYMRWIRFVSVGDNRFGVLEANGHKFRALDHFTYHREASPTNEDDFDKWYENILNNSKKVKQFHEFTNDFSLCHEQVQQEL